MITPMRSFLCAVIFLSMSATPTFADDVVLPDGTDWRRATEQERLAYITGFSNALSLGYISDEKHIPENKESFTHRVASGLYGTSIEQGVAIIDAWYKSHPDQLATPALQVLWDQAGKPRLESSSKQHQPQKLKP